MATATPEQTTTTSPSQFRMTSHRCGTCDVSFSSVQEMRAHAKGQLHVENLRRRLVEQDPIAHEPEKDYGDYPSASEEEEEEEEDVNSDASIHSDSDTPSQALHPPSIPPFDSNTCLFCRETTSDFDSNLTHMSKSHGFTVPSPESLLVDPETLLSYLYLVIEGYRECILCGTQRNNPHAIRRHMLDKSHCRLDISPASEYSDFYSKQDTGAHNYQLTIATTHLHVRSDEGTLSLASGKILASRSAPAPRPPRLSRDKDNNNATTTTEKTVADGTTSTDLTPRSSGALTKAEKRDVTLASKMTMLSVSDQKAIAHLTPSEQRATIERRDREMQRARRADRRMMSRVEALSNKTKMHHYRPAGNERPNG